MGEDPGAGEPLTFPIAVGLLSYASLDFVWIPDETTGLTNPGKCYIMGITDALAASGRYLGI